MSYGRVSLARPSKTDCHILHLIASRPSPFPLDIEAINSWRILADRTYDLRAALMIRNNEGLTKTYNRFHRPDEHSPQIVGLRRLHDQMDRAVLDAYGWHDLQPVTGFLLRSLTTKMTKTKVAAPPVQSRGNTVIGGRTTCMMRCSPACSRSISSAPPCKRPPETIAPGKAKQAKLKSKPSTKEEPVIILREQHGRRDDIRHRYVRKAR